MIPGGTGTGTPGAVRLGTNRPVNGGKIGNPLDTAPGTAPKAGVNTTTIPVTVPAGDWTSVEAARALEGTPPSPATSVTRTEMTATNRFAMDLPSTSILSRRLGQRSPMRPPAQ